MCVHARIIPKRCSEIHWYRNILLQLSMQNTLRNGIQNFTTSSSSNRLMDKLFILGKDSYLDAKIYGFGSGAIIRVLHPVWSPHPHSQKFFTTFTFFFFTFVQFIYSFVEIESCFFPLSISAIEHPISIQNFQWPLRFVIYNWPSNLVLIPI